MSQRALLLVGVIAIAASFVGGGAAIAVGAAGAPFTGWFGAPAAQSITIDRAQQSVQSFLDRTEDQDLQIDELMEFQQNFYALIKEKSTGVGAFEVLVDKRSGVVGFEPGPNMMWNTKYSMMRGSPMMGGGPFRIARATTVMPVTPDAATGIAQAWIDGNRPGDSAGTADEFYGYYTFHFEANGKIAGMLSVNGYSGQVWFHTWHGAFIQERDFGA